MLRCIMMAAVFCVATAWSGGAAAQTESFPNNTIKIVVPTAPGGPLDVLARLIADPLRDAWGGQPVIIENRPGGALMIGANAVAKSKPDGYTLLLANDGPISINPNLYKKMSYDPQKELAPVTMVVDAPFILVVNPEVKAKTVAEFIALAKANPGKINYASGGNTSRLAAELFRLAAGISIINVPYSGSGQAIIGVVRGDAQMMVDGLTSSLPHVYSGKLRALGVGTPQRIKTLSDIPAVAETVPGYTGTTWLGLFAPAGTPPEIINKLHSGVAKVVHSPAISEKLSKLGMYPVANRPDEFAKFIASDTAKWGRVIREAAIPQVE
jgi:tripartite-type tricarboxylate transporter receptor subunit TctC